MLALLPHLCLVAPIIYRKFARRVFLSIARTLTHRSAVYGTGTGRINGITDKESAECWTEQIAIAHGLLIDGYTLRI